MAKRRLGTTVKETFGPVVFVSDSDGSMRASCEYCTFVLIFQGQKWANCRYDRPSRRIDDYNHTPDWCVMKEDMLRDAAEDMAAVAPRVGTDGA